MRSERRDSRLLVGAVGLSAAGDYVAIFALALYVREITDSGLAVAGVFIASWLPSVLLASWAGHLVDRRESVRLLMLSSLAQAAVAVALAVCTGVAPILVLALLLGAGAAVSSPAEFAIAPAVAGAPERVAALNGKVETARYAGFTAGPLIGTSLFALGGLSVALVVDAVSFLAIAAAAWGMHARRAPAPAADDDAPPVRLEGFRLLLSEATLRIAVLTLTLSLVLMSAVIPAEVFFWVEDVDVGNVGFGVLTSIWMAGMVLGSVRLASRVAIPLLAVAVLLGTAVQGTAILTAALLGTFLGGALAYIVGGIAHGIKNVTGRTLLHLRVPERAHGRAFAAWNALRNGAEMGALALGGVLVELIGARETMYVAGAGSALVGVVALVALRAGPPVAADPA